MKNFNKLSKILSISLCLALVVCIASCVLLVIFGVRKDLYTPPDTQKKSAAKLSSTHDYGDIYIKQMLFFADSAMADISKFDMISDKNDIITGRSGDMPLDFNTSTAETSLLSQDGKAQSIVDIVALKKPKYLLISIGLNNGVEHCTEQKFKEYYTKLIDAVKEASPETKIILQSVFPVSRKVSFSEPDKSNKKIDEANEWIEQLCNSLSVKYLNTAEVLKGTGGSLKSEYDSGDGIHLNEKGYNEVVTYIRTHGYK